MLMKLTADEMVKLLTSQNTIKSDFYLIFLVVLYFEIKSIALIIDKGISEMYRNCE
jgi:hypothetical protein